jgi:soluble P-type ATPase
VPVAIVAGISRAARRGVVVKGGGVLERLAGARVLLFDKTGTLTAGTPEVVAVEAADGDADRLLALAASVDQVSPHVLAAAIVRAAAARGLPTSFPAGVVEVPGRGIRGRVGDRRVAVGKAAFAVPGGPLPAWARRLRRRGATEGFFTVFVAVDGVLAGALGVRDPVRPDTPRTVRELRRAGVRRIVMVTGDHPDTAEAVAAAVGVDQVLAERSPADKVEAVRLELGVGVTVMVGDGVNDAPALAAADVGVAMGARGATASSQAADVVMVVDRLDLLAEAIGLARRSRTIALQSVLAGMGLSLAAMVAAAAGLLAPVPGAVLQEAIDVAVIANALRARAAGGAGGARRPLPPSLVALGERFRGEHRQLLVAVDRIRSLADRLDALPPAEALAQVGGGQGHRFLVERLLPHEGGRGRAALPGGDRVGRRRRPERDDEPGPRGDRPPHAPARAPARRPRPLRPGRQGPGGPAPGTLRAACDPAAALRPGGGGVPAAVRSPRRAPGSQDRLTGAGDLPKGGRVALGRGPVPA